MPEKELFQTDQKVPRTEIAQMLRDTADQIEFGDVILEDNTQNRVLLWQKILISIFASNDSQGLNLIGSNIDSNTKYSGQNESLLILVNITTMIS